MGSFGAWQSVSGRAGSYVPRAYQALKPNTWVCLKLLKKLSLVEE